jgi:hypothetical protein
MSQGCPLMTPTKTLMKHASEKINIHNKNIDLTCSAYGIYIK